MGLSFLLTVMLAADLLLETTGAIIELNTANPIGPCSEKPGQWIRFQQRGKYDVSFQEDFNKYECGFGQPCNDGDFWLGLKQLNQLTNKGDWELRIITTDLNTGKIWWNQYKGFKIGNGPEYRLKYTSWVEGNAGNDFGTGHGLDKHHGMAFSALDKDQDMSPDNCAAAYGNTGWWYNFCMDLQLNGNPPDNSYNPNNVFYKVTVDRKRWRWFPVRSVAMEMRQTD